MITLFYSLQLIVSLIMICGWLPACDLFVINQRETIQDLLSPANVNNPNAEENLNVRQDPSRGFYVDGLQEYIVRNYSEAEALVNLVST